MEKQNRPRWATLELAGQYVGRHPRTVRRWIESGRIPGYRNGLYRVEVNLDDLDEIARTRLPASSPDGR